MNRPRPARLALGSLPILLAAASLAMVSPASSAPGPDPRVDRQEETGKVGFIGASPAEPIDVGLPADTAPAVVATTYLEQNARRLGLDAPGTELAVVADRAGRGAARVVRVAQEHEGIPVLGGEFTVNLDQHDNVLSVLGEASPVGTVDTEPTIGPRAAARAGMAKVSRDELVPANLLQVTESELSLYDPRLLGAPDPFETARLSWVLDVRSKAPGIAHTVVVDAATGTVALSFSTIAHARDRVVCDANNTSSNYPCTSPVWTEASQPGGADPDVVAAFEYAGDTYDFFSDRFGRDSLDGAGMQLVSTADYCHPSFACPYLNAFWDGSQMVYGDGFAVADDVVGHELAHGVTDFSSSLFYYMQSGAINESMSDIFGELIDLTNGSGTDTAGARWLVGEDIPGLGAIRNMADPTSFGDPDRMNSPLYDSDPAEGDGGGVHSNSGVSNKAAALLVDGGTFNGHTVSALGVDKTALLFYTVNDELLVSGSDFADLANGLRQACTNLSGTGVGGFTAGDCTEVEDAVLATEMDLGPAAAPTSTATVCPAGAPSFVHRDDLETPAGQFTVMSIVGSEVWSYPQNPNGLAGFDATYATSGETNVWGYARGATSDSALRMTTAVLLPDDAYLHFNHAHGFEDGAEFYDGGVLEYSVTGAAGPWLDAGPLLAAPGGAGGYGGTITSSFDNPLGGRPGFVAESNGYGASRADLSALAGESVMFRWRIGTDSIADDYGWFIDDISIHTCAALDTDSPQTTITKHPRGRTSKRRAVFRFESDEVDSTFRCKLDRRRWQPCTSPKKYRVKPGKHTFRVRATDAADNTDPTPARWKWRVKRRR